MLSTKKKLNIGVLGCGPIAQFAHFEACQKAGNAELYAICDAADDLLQRMNAVWQPTKTFNDYRLMLEDPELDAVIVATSDSFHVPLSLMAVEAGKHVLVEKPLSHSIEECIALKRASGKHQIIVQVGHMKRFDPGIQFAQNFIKNKIGEILAIKAWYCDHLQRYTETDNFQPLPVRSKESIKPLLNEKNNLERYYMMAHGSHLIDTVLFLGGSIRMVQARLKKLNDAYCWFISIEFNNGALGHLDLTIKLKSDWNEGFTVYGDNGSVFAKTYNPWYYKSSEVECYLETEQQFYRPLGADGFTYRRQLEHFSNRILHQVPTCASGIEEGLEIAKTMIAINKSLVENRTVYIDEIQSGVL